MEIAASTEARTELLSWINSQLPDHIAPIRKIEDCGRGVPYVVLLPYLFPSEASKLASSSRMKKQATHDFEAASNLKLLQDVLQKHNIHRPPALDDHHKLIKGNYQANLALLQWFKGFADVVKQRREKQEEAIVAAHSSSFVGAGKDGKGGEASPRPNSSLVPPSGSTKAVPEGVVEGGGTGAGGGGGGGGSHSRLAVVAAPSLHTASAGTEKLAGRKLLKSSPTGKSNHVSHLSGGSSNDNNSSSMRVTTANGGGGNSSAHMAKTLLTSTSNAGIISPLGINASNELYSVREGEHGGGEPKRNNSKIGSSSDGVGAGRGSGLTPGGGGGGSTSTRTTTASGERTTPHPLPAKNSTKKKTKKAITRPDNEETKGGLGTSASNRAAAFPSGSPSFYSLSSELLAGSVGEIGSENGTSTLGIAVNKGGGKSPLFLIASQREGGIAGAMANLPTTTTSGGGVGGSSTRLGSATMGGSSWGSDGSLAGSGGGVVAHMTTTAAVGTTNPTCTTTSAGSLRRRASTSACMASPKTTTDANQKHPTTLSSNSSSNSSSNNSPALLPSRFLSSNSAGESAMGVGSSTTPEKTSTMAALRRRSESSSNLFGPNSHKTGKVVPPPPPSCAAAGLGRQSSSFVATKNSLSQTKTPGSVGGRMRRSDSEGSANEGSGVHHPPTPTTVTAAADEEGMMVGRGETGDRGIKRMTAQRGGGSNSSGNSMARSGNRKDISSRTNSETYPRIAVPPPLTGDHPISSPPSASSLHTDLSFSSLISGTPSSTSGPSLPSSTASTAAGLVGGVYSSTRSLTPKGALGRHGSQLNNHTTHTTSTSSTTMNNTTRPGMSNRGSNTTTTATAPTNNNNHSFGSRSMNSTSLNSTMKRTSSYGGGLNGEGREEDKRRIGRSMVAEKGGAEGGEDEDLRARAPPPTGYAGEREGSQVERLGGAGQLYRMTKGMSGAAAAHSAPRSDGAVDNDDEHSLRTTTTTTTTINSNTNRGSHRNGSGGGANAASSISNSSNTVTEGGVSTRTSTGTGSGPHWSASNPHPIGGKQGGGGGGGLAQATLPASQIGRQREASTRQISQYTSPMGSPHPSGRPRSSSHLRNGGNRNSDSHHTNPHPHPHHTPTSSTSTTRTPRMILSGMSSGSGAVGNISASQTVAGGGGLAIAPSVDLSDEEAIEEVLELAARERQFFYDKLRMIERLVVHMAAKDLRGADVAAVALARSIRDVLYATN